MESIFQHITQALGWSILHSLWQGTLIYSIVYFFIIGQPKISAKWRHMVALFSQYVVFLAFITTFGISLNTKNQFMSPETVVQNLSQNTAISMTDIVASYLQSALPWFSALYLVGILIQIIVCCNSYARLNFIRKTGVSGAPEAWVESLNDLKTKIGINSNIILQLSNKITVPLTLGHFKPIILFPFTLVNNLDITQVEAIILHELSHIKRCDYLLNLIKISIETLMFFNPFIWLLSRQIESERENACDDFVLGYTGSPIAYAQTLMSVELLRSDAPPQYAMAATNNKHYLLNRIKRITKMEQKYNRIRQDLFVIGLGTLTLIAIACTAPKKMTTEKASPTTTVRNTLAAIPVNPEITPIIPLTEKKQTPIKPKKIQKLELDLQKNTEEVQAIFNSSEWKQKVKNVQEQSLNVAQIANSQEMQRTIESITEDALNVAKIFQSEEYLSLLTDSEKNAAKIAAYSESPEFKAKIAKIEKSAKNIEDYYNSPEWDDKIKQIEKNAKQLEEYLESPEFKSKINMVEESAKKVDDYYDSQEWKEGTGNSQE